MLTVTKAIQSALNEDLKEAESEKTRRMQRKRISNLTLQQLEAEEREVDTMQRRKRRCLTIEEKINILDRLQIGERVADLSRIYKINERSIRLLQSNKNKLRAYATKCSDKDYKSGTYIQRDQTLLQTEHILHSWHEAKKAQGQKLSMASICEKAREIYAEQRKLESAANSTLDTKTNLEYDSDYELEVEQREFKASKGWFQSFRKRYKLDFKSTAETKPLDAEAAQTFPLYFKNCIEHGDYQPQQVFNAAELALPWKNMPERSNIMLHERLRNNMGHHRISLLLCGNATGDFCVKPMLIYRTLAPFCLRSRNIADLPVFWRARSRRSQCNPKVTMHLFHEWLTECFIPKVRDFLTIMELPQRCLLLLAAELFEAHDQLPPYDKEFVQLEFLPANTANLLQPIAISVVPTFQCYYFRHLLEYFVNALEKSSTANLYKIWRNFSIAEAVDIIQEALEEVSTVCWNSGWESLWKEIVHKPFSPSMLSNEIQQMVEIGSQIPSVGFIDMTAEDVQNYLKLDYCEMNNIITMEDATVDTENEDNDNECEVEAALPDDENNCAGIVKEILENIAATTTTTKTTSQTSSEVCDANTQNCNKTENMNKVQSINKALMLSEQLIATVSQVNSNHVEHTKFISQLNDLMQPYKELKERLLQPSVRDYFRSK